MPTFTKYPRPTKSGFNETGSRMPVMIANPRGGAPKGNRSAVRHGWYSDMGRARRAQIAELTARVELAIAMAEAEIVRRAAARTEAP